MNMSVIETQNILNKIGLAKKNETSNVTLKDKQIEMLKNQLNQQKLIEEQEKASLKEQLR